MLLHAEIHIHKEAFRRRFYIGKKIMCIFIFYDLSSPRVAHSFLMDEFFTIPNSPSVTLMFPRFPIRTIRNLKTLSDLSAIEVAPREHFGGQFPCLFRSFDFFVSSLNNNKKDDRCYIRLYSCKQRYDI